MIVWNELKITLDDKCIIIEVSIEDKEAFKNITIDWIKIDNLNTFIPTCPSEKSLLVYNINPDEGIVFTDNDVIKDPEHKHIRLELQKDGVQDSVLQKIEGNMFFIWVKANTDNAGAELFETSCTCSKDLEMCSLVNMYPMYKKLMNNLKELGDTCTVPKDFINNYLQIQAIDAAIKTGNYSLAIKYWSKFVNNTIYTNTTHKHCGCHGRF